MLLVRFGLWASTLPCTESNGATSCQFVVIQKMIFTLGVFANITMGIQWPTSASSTVELGLVPARDEGYLQLAARFAALRAATWKFVILKG